jgi:two-component system, NtrC family, response regulator HydG
MSEERGPAVPAARSILVVDDDRELLRALDRTLKGAGYAVRACESGEDAISSLRDGIPDVVVSDLLLPGMDGIELLRELKAAAPATEVLMMTAHGTIERAVEAMRGGAYDFVEKPIERDRLLRAVSRAFERRDLSDENRRLRERLRDHDARVRMVGESPAMVELRRLASQIAPADVPVLVTGESGTGKEVVADLLHALSSRSAGPLIKISCAAIPETLIESELFGYERGAFSGAQQTKRGRFELASGGTLFLDEIGEMTGPMQAKLLRVLEEHSIVRLGGTRAVPVDVRLVAATNVDLTRALREGKFREDLYHRINVIEIAMPPLRERSGDLPLLVAHFLDRHHGLRARPLEGIAPEAMDRLSAHPWPGNVRELENVLQRALVVAPGPRLEATDLQFAHHAAPLAAASPGVAIPRGASIAEAEEILIADALERAGGDKEKAARLLGISARTLYRRTSRDPESPPDEVPGATG